MSTIFLCHSIGPVKHNSNYNTLQEVAESDGVLTFDGVYHNVWENRAILKGRDMILFVIGDSVGRDNRWDVGQPLERFCSYDELDDLVAHGADLGWHTWTHPDLTTLSDADLEEELTPPPWVGTRSFAYPYGKWDARVLEAVSAIFGEAYSTGRGDNSRHQRRRRHI